MDALRNKFPGSISKDTIAFVIGLLVLVLCILYGTYKQYDIADNQKKTNGEILEFYHSTRARYGLKYRYWVGDKEYIGSTGVSPFKCDNGKKGCVGQEFPVYYSSENPQYSRIDLGKYEKYKTTVEFVK
ncbi:DUF3592 domain-containing protein [Maribacter luteus]|uniref:DUF3592 domain-containing protein n=1 Tax=Maribacter luteus TaxID=2594478 RepID=UPI0024927B4E|nr:DUF3592 domain-containing protein [Maribacter luteus]